MIKKILYLFLALFVWLWIFYLDFFMYKDIDSKSDIESYLQWNYDIFWLISFKKNLLTKSWMEFDSFTQKTNVDIPIQKLLFYQKEYWKIPNISCDDYQKLKLQRNYIIEPTYEDKSNLLKSKNNQEDNKEVTTEQRGKKKNKRTIE